MNSPGDKKKRNSSKRFYLVEYKSTLWRRLNDIPFIFDVMSLWKPLKKKRLQEFYLLTQAFREYY